MSSLKAAASRKCCCLTGLQT